MHGLPSTNPDSMEVEDLRDSLGEDPVSGVSVPSRFEDIVDASIDESVFEVGRGVRVPDIHRARTWARLNQLEWKTSKSQLEFARWVSSRIESVGIPLSLFFRRLGLHSSNGTKWLRGKLPHGCTSRLILTLYFFALSVRDHSILDQCVQGGSKAVLRFLQEARVPLVEHLRHSTVLDLLGPPPVSPSNASEAADASLEGGQPKAISTSSQSHAVAVSGSQMLSSTSSTSLSLQGIA